MVVEQLCARRLLAVSVAGNVLQVTGTEGADRIAVTATRFVNALLVDDNGASHDFSLSAIKSINIDARGGNDRVVVDTALNAMKYDCVIKGGAGDDTLAGARKNVTVAGNDGDDKIRGLGTGSNNLSGGNGRDSMFGRE